MFLESRETSASFIATCTYQGSQRPPAEHRDVLAVLAVPQGTVSALFEIVLL